MNNLSFRVDATSCRATASSAGHHRADRLPQRLPDRHRRAGLDDRIQSSIAAGDTFTISPATILDISSGFTRYRRAPSQPAGDMAKYGFPQAYIRLVQQQKIRCSPTATWPASAPRKATAGQQLHLVHANEHAAPAQPAQPEMGIPGSAPWADGDLGGRPPALSPSTAASPRDLTLFPRHHHRPRHRFLPARHARERLRHLQRQQRQHRHLLRLLFHDDIRLSQRLTLNLGMRYELFFCPPSNATSH